MDWRNRLPRPPGSRLPGNLLAVFKMSPEEYRRELRAQGFGDAYIDRELAELERAREQHPILRPAPSPAPPSADDGVFELLLRRRKERQRRSEDRPEP